MAKAKAKGHPVFSRRRFEMQSGKPWGSDEVCILHEDSVSESKLLLTGWGRSDIPGKASAPALRADGLRENLVGEEVFAQLRQIPPPGR